MDSDASRLIAFRRLKHEQYTVLNPDCSLCCTGRRPSGYGICRAERVFSGPLCQCKYTGCSRWDPPDHQHRSDVREPLRHDLRVHTADQQMAECCGCLESPDNLNTLSVNNDLTSNPLTSTIPTTGVIKIVPTTVNDAPCDARQYTPIVLTVILDNWIVFPVVVSDPLHILIEFKSVPVGLSSQELAALQSQCTFIGILGSGRGICTCGSGSSSPVKKKK